MEKERISYFEQLSKYVLGEIVEYFEYKDILNMRTINSTFNKASVLIWKRRLGELEIIIQMYKSEIESKFEPKSNEEYKDLMSEDESVRKHIWHHLSICKKGGVLFKNIRELEYLRKPFGTVVYPVYFIWILFGNPILQDAGNYNLIWPKIKGICKNKQIIENMKNYDPRKITNKMIQHIEGIINLNNDYLNYDILIHVSRICAHSFEWALSMIEHKHLLKTILDSPLHLIYSKIQNYGKNFHKMSAIYYKVLAPYFEK